MRSSARFILPQSHRIASCAPGSPPRDDVILRRRAPDRRPWGTLQVYDSGTVEGPSVDLFSCISQVRDNVASPEPTAKSLLENGIGRRQLSRFEIFIPTDEFSEIFN